jgi:hypothetical protein
LFNPAVNDKKYRVFHMHRGVSALRMSQVVLVALLGKSFGVVLIQLDASLNPNNSLAESGHQC